MRKLARVGRPRRRSASERADLGEGERSGGRCRLVDEVGEQAGQLVALPGVSGRRGGELVGGVGDRVDPAIDRLRSAQCRDRRGEAVDELGEAAGELDVAAVDVVERQHAVDEAEVVLGHRHAEQQAVEAGLPRVVGAVVELERERGARRRGPSGSPPRRPTPRCA